MVAAGIVDPLKVVRTALVDAASVASVMTTSEAVVVEARDKDATPAAAAPATGLCAFIFLDIDCWFCMVQVSACFKGLFPWIISGCGIIFTEKSMHRICMMGLFYPVEASYPQH